MGAEGKAGQWGLKDEPFLEIHPDEEFGVAEGWNWRAMKSSTIAIPVDDEAARAYGNASQEQQRKIQLLLKLRLRDLTMPPGRPLAEVMNDVGARAKKRGLTRKALASLLLGS